LRWIESSDVPDDNLYRESLSLVIENTGTKTVRGIPIEVHARIEPQKPADVVVAFSGDRESVMEAGKPRPVGVVLSMPLQPGQTPLCTRRQCSIRGAIQSHAGRDEGRRARPSDQLCARTMIWLRRLLILIVAVILLLSFVVLPIGGSFLITNSHFRYNERGPHDPEAVGLHVENVEFKTVDGLMLRGWWSSGKAGFPVIIFAMV